MEVHDVCEAGDYERLAELLREEPALASKPVGPKNAPPLISVCFSRGRDLEALTRCARLLLDAGADPNAFYVEPDWPDSPQTALYGASGVQGNAALTRLLLQAGARTQDGESIYHAAEHAHLDCLQALHEFGADFSARQQPWNNTPLYFLFGHDPESEAFSVALRGISWMLEHGANPNVGSYEHGETPLHAAARLHRGETIELLLRHGSDPCLGTRTPYAIAVRFGNLEAVEALKRHGGETPLSDDDQLMGAIARGEVAEGRRLLEQGASLAEDWPGLAILAAGQGRDEYLRTAATLGLALDVRGDQGATPLHFAAWYGHLSTVELLLSTKPPLETRDRVFNSTPLGCACHGSLNCRPGDNYPAIVRALLQAGAQRTGALEASDAVNAVLRQES